MASKEFSNTLKNLRIKAGYTQKQVYEHFDIPQSTFSSWEVGKSEPSGDMLVKLCDFYNCDLLKEISGAGNFGFTSSELSVLEKYRFIFQHSPAGIATVDHILDREYAIAKLNKKQTDTLAARDARIAELEVITTPTKIITYYQSLASAGTGEYLFDSIPTDALEVPVTTISKQADFVIGINGESMEPTYHDGEKVYVRITDKVTTGTIGVFTKGNECFIKELGINCLISHNHAGGYRDIPVDEEDIKLVGEVLGKVEESCHIENF